ncbi:MAG: succinate dehydrogenase [Betaproteobacteria bacterium SG8_39]|nr:MAG: succinate dehydrogenase [Betaproteobacteria bacterium SG8_39]
MDRDVCPPAIDAAAAEGLETLLVEKSDFVGGTTAISGGMVWVPANPKMQDAGIDDSLDSARAYLDAVAPALRDPAVREAFLTRGNEALAYLEAHTALRLRPVTNYPDYYPDAPGATLGGRVLEPVEFDGYLLGRSFALLRWPLPEFMLFGGMMIGRPDLPHFRAVTRSPRAALRVARLVLEYAWQRFFAPRGTRLVLGNALVAQLFKTVLDRRVALRFGTRATRVVIEDGRAVGVEIVQDGARGAATETLRARAGVVLATGGFSHDAPLRAELLPPSVSAASPVCASSSGDGLRAGLEAGGVLGMHNSHNAFWAPVSRFQRADGSEGVFPHTVTERGKPGIIALAASGKRFTSEAVSYHEFVLAMFRGDAQGAAVPAYLLCDRKSLWQYGLGAVKPFGLGRAAHTASGYLVEAHSLDELARRLEIDPAALAQTIAGYNADARHGVDSAYGLGENPYQRFLGDRDNAPNPCMRPIETPPYYAIRLYPSDLGTIAGLMTDTEARVLDAAGRPIAGLFACGNDMNSVMDGAYPGPGITLGPALVFGYLASRTIARDAKP